MQGIKPENTSELLANERTFLAWVRTSIGIMAFGFVVVKFSLFLKQVGMLLTKQSVAVQHGLSGIIGIVLVAAGAATLLLSFFQYKKTEWQINKNNYRSSSILASILTVFIFLVSILLIVYLFDSI